MPNRDRLGDHPSHGHTADVGLRDSKSVQKSYRVVSHIIQGVGRRNFLALHEFPEDFNEVRHAGFIEFGGEPNIPVIKSDDIVTAFCEVFAKVIIPMDHLPAKADDQKKRSVRWVSEGFILNLNSIGSYSRHFGTSSLTLAAMILDYLNVLQIFEKRQEIIPLDAVKIFPHVLFQRFILFHDLAKGNEKFIE